MTAIILMPSGGHGNPPGDFDPPGRLARLAYRARDASTTSGGSTA